MSRVNDRKLPTAQDMLRRDKTAGTEASTKAQEQKKKRDQEKRLKAEKRRKTGEKFSAAAKGASQAAAQTAAKKTDQAAQHQAGIRANAAYSAASQGTPTVGKAADIIKRKRI